MLAQEFKRLGLISTDIPATSVLATQHGFKQEDDFLAAIGHGDHSAHRTALLLLESLRPPQDDSPLPPIKRGQTPKKHAAKGVRFDGITGVLSEAAACCHPVPGDAVRGYISRSRGIVIHRQSCPNIRHSQEPERLAEIEWNQEDTGTSLANIQIKMTHQPGSFKRVLDVITQLNINMESAHSVPANNTAPAKQHQVIQLSLHVHSTDQLLRLLTKLENLACVESACRMSH